MTRGARRTVAVLILAGAGIAAAPTTLALGAMPAPAVVQATVRVVPMGGTCTSLFCFKPPFVKIANNNAVSWVNRSTVTHTITRCTPTACSGHGGGTGTDTGLGTSGVSPGQRYTFKFDAPGTYAYYCAIHGYAVMHGTISVH
jgi:plastocyanin